jgi:hypothetical protein
MKLPISNTYINFSRHHFCCFTIAPLFVLDKSMAWNSLWLQHPCFKNLCRIAQASKIPDSNAHHFLSDLLTHSWFQSMLFPLPCYQFPYTVMNRCFYLKHTHTHTHCVTWMNTMMLEYFWAAEIRIGGIGRLRWSRSRRRRTRRRWRNGQLEVDKGRPCGGCVPCQHRYMLGSK